MALDACPKPAPLDCPRPNDYGGLLHFNTGPNRPAPPASNPYAVQVQAGGSETDVVQANAALFTATIHGIKELEKPGYTAADLAAAVVARELAMSHQLRTLDEGPRRAVLAFEFGSMLRLDETRATLQRRVGEAWQDWVTIKRPAAASLVAMARTLASTEFLNERTQRLQEIAVQDRESLLPAFVQLAGLQTGRHQRTLEMLRIAVLLSQPVLHRLKQHLAVPRPIDLLPGLRAVVEVPAHGAMPSGHACTAFLIAELLAHCAAQQGRQNLRPFLRRVAARIAENRVLAGLHYVSDAIAGALLGTAMAELLIQAEGVSLPVKHRFELPSDAAVLHFGASIGDSFEASATDLSAALAGLGWTQDAGTGAGTALPLWNQVLTEALDADWR